MSVLKNYVKKPDFLNGQETRSIYFLRGGEITDASRTVA